MVAQGCCNHGGTRRNRLAGELHLSMKHGRLSTASGGGEHGGGCRRRQTGERQPGAALHDVAMTGRPPWPAVFLQIRNANRDEKEGDGLDERAFNGSGWANRVAGARPAETFDRRAGAYQSPYI